MELIAIDASGATARPVGDLSDEAKDARQATLDLYAVVGHHAPWIGYLAEEEGECVGACAFKSPPADGRVEIAYYTFPQHEGLGYATAMAGALIGIARQADAGLTIVAQTMAEEGASPHILGKLGFELVEEFEDPLDGPLWEWALPPSTA